MIPWLERVLSACFEDSGAPRDFRDVFVVLVYKGKGGMCVTVVGVYMSDEWSRE